MSVTRVWLTERSHQELRAELHTLLQQREAVAPVDGREHGGPEGPGAEERDREQRIRRLQELLRDPVVGDRPPDDGVAEPGMAVTVRYDDGETETFLLSHDENRIRPDGTMICSPDSPLGRALHGAHQGDAVRYRLPDGGWTGCTLLRAVPYDR